MKKTAFLLLFALSVASAWFIFSVLGSYPVNPVGGEFVKGEAQVKALKKLPWD